MWVTEVEAMSTVIDQNLRGRAGQPLNSLTRDAAANDDHLPGAGSERRELSEVTGGWNAHDVWRRLIKEARDRREATGKLEQ
jgi:hypothetical protein